MADLSKIKLNGTQYNIKDAVAREELLTKIDLKGPIYLHSDDNIVYTDGDNKNNPITETLENGIYQAHLVAVSNILNSTHYFINSELIFIIANNFTTDNKYYFYLSDKDNKLHYENNDEIIIITYDEEVESSAFSKIRDNFSNNIPTYASYYDAESNSNILLLLTSQTILPNNEGSVFNFSGYRNNVFYTCYLTGIDSEWSDMKQTQSLLPENSYTDTETNAQYSTSIQNNGNDFSIYYNKEQQETIDETGINLTDTLELYAGNNDNVSSININSTYININSPAVQISGVVTPTNNDDAANKEYVDEAISNAAPTITNTLSSGTLIATINGTNIYAPAYTDADGVSY